MHLKAISAITYAEMAIMTVNPRFFVLSLIHAKNNTTGSVRKPPIAVRALAWMRENPRDMIMLGVYVVKGLQVEKAQAVARKCGHFRMLVTVCHTTARGIICRCVFSGARESSSVAVLSDVD